MLLQIQIRKLMCRTSVSVVSVRCLRYGSVAFPLAVFSCESIECLVASVLLGVTCVFLQATRIQQVTRVVLGSFRCYFHSAVHSRKFSGGPTSPVDGQMSLVNPMSASLCLSVRVYVPHLVEQCKTPNGELRAWGRQSTPRFNDRW